MKRKSIRFSIASLTGTLMLGVAALPASSLVGLLPDMAGLLFIGLAASGVVRRLKQQTDRHAGVAQPSRTASAAHDTPDSIDDLARQITHAVNVVRRLPRNDINIDALRAHLRSLADQANLLALSTAIDAVTTREQHPDVAHTSNRRCQVVPIRRDDTELTRLAEQQRRLINQFKV